MELNIQTATQRHENRTLGEVYWVYDCNLGGLSVGDRRYLGYPIREETTFNNPSYLGDPHCDQERTANETADSEGTEDSCRTEMDSESDFQS